MILRDSHVPLASLLRGGLDPFSFFFTATSVQISAVTEGGAKMPPETPTLPEAIVRGLGSLSSVDGSL